MNSYGRRTGDPGIIVADRSRLVAQGICLSLKKCGLKVLSPARSCEEAVALSVDMQPGVIILDAALLNCEEDFAQFYRLSSASAGVRVLVLGLTRDPQFVAFLLRAGAAGYLYKDLTPEQLVHAIDTITNGQVLIEADIAEAVLAASVAVPQIVKMGKSPSQSLNLTSRELGILQLLAQGRSNLDISKELNISISTVKSHVHNVLYKLNVSSRIEASAWYVTFRQQDRLQYANSPKPEIETPTNRN